MAQLVQARLLSCVSDVRAVLIFDVQGGGTSEIGNGTHCCTTGAAVGEHQPFTLPWTSATDASVVGMTIGDFPPSGHLRCLLPFSNSHPIVNCVSMQRHVEAGAGGCDASRVFQSLLSGRE